MNPAFTYDGAFPQRSSSRRPPPPPNFRVDPRLVWQNGGAETTNQTRLVAPMEWRSWERESAAEAALNPTFVPDLRLRHPPPPSAEYLSTRLSDNPLGLLNMVPREELFGPMSDEGHGIPAATPWISNPRGLDDMVTTQHVALGENQEAIHTQVPALLRPPARTAYLAEPLSDNPLGLMNMVPREELYGTRDEPAPTPWMWNPRGLSEDISTTGPDVGEHNDILRSPVAPPGHLQFGRHDAGYALGYINGLLSSWENRVNLRSIVMISDAAPRGVPSSGALHNNLEVIEGQIDTSLTQILKSRGARQAARQLGEIKMQSLIDAIQDVLDRGTLPNAKSRSKARRLMRKLTEAHEQLPSSLFIRGVNDHDEHPTFGGGFGDVYRASYQGKMVALKRIRMFTVDSTSHHSRLQFCKEALVWQGLDHRFILPLIGIDRETFHPSFCMVSPWMKHGTVLKYLRDRGRGDVDRLLLQIAEGLEYLHSMNIIHGDLRGANVLISDDGSACLSDFGLTTTISDADTSTLGGASSSADRGGSLRWQAPELIDPHSMGFERFLRTPASDVYAYGCVCLELYTGKPPFSELSADGGVIFRVLKGERPEKPTNITGALWNLVTVAWAHHANDRPTIYQIVADFPNPGKLSPLLV